MRYVYIRIGIDNVDSYWGGCTTHFGYITIKKLIELGGGLFDYPKLIRLNPDIPWKTRGNGSVSLDAYIPKNKVLEFTKWLRESLIKYVEEINGFSIKNQPGVIVLNGDKLLDKDLSLLNSIYKKALWTIVPTNEALETMDLLSEKILLKLYPFGPKGLVGALAALGAFLNRDYTYELLIYRNLNSRDRERFKYIDEETLKILEEDEGVFANIDHETGKILITPGGPDPVVAGIRGNNLSRILSIFRKLAKYIVYDGWVIYVTNQGTNEHLYISRNEADYYNEVLINVSFSKGETLKGGHVIIESKYKDTPLMINFYYESGKMRKIINKIYRYNVPCFVGGGMKPNTSEYEARYVINPQLVIFQLSTVEIEEEVKPLCPKCKVSLKSGGKGDILKCKKCSYSIKKTKAIIHKNINIPNLILPPYRSILHISKPLKRMGREKKQRLYGLKNSVWIDLKTT